MTLKLFCCVASLLAVLHAAAAIHDGPSLNGVPPAGAKHVSSILPPPGSLQAPAEYTPLPATQTAPEQRLPAAYVRHPVVKQFKAAHKLQSFVGGMVRGDTAGIQEMNQREALMRKEEDRVDEFDRQNAKYGRINCNPLAEASALGLSHGMGGWGSLGCVAPPGSCQQRRSQMYNQWMAQGKRVDQQEPIPCVWTCRRPPFNATSPILVGFDQLSGSNKDWITIVPRDKAEDKYDEWHYTDGKKNGTMEFSAKGVGQYEIRVYFNWKDGGYNVKAEYAFNVTDTPMIGQNGQPWNNNGGYSNGNSNGYSNGNNGNSNGNNGANSGYSNDNNYNVDQTGQAQGAGRAASR